MTGGNIRNIYLVEGAISNIAADTRDNSFYHFGLLTDDEKGPFHKQGFFIDKYKLNGKKYFSKEYSFMDFKPQCKEIDDELCDHGMTNANQRCMLYTDQEEIMLIVPRLTYGYVFTFLMTSGGDIKKVVYGRGASFGLYGPSEPRTNGESGNENFARQNTI